MISDGPHELRKPRLTALKAWLEENRTPTNEKALVSLPTAREATGTEAQGRRCLLRASSMGP